MNICEYRRCSAAEKNVIGWKHSAQVFLEERADLHLQVMRSLRKAVVNKMRVQQKNKGTLECRALQICML